MDRRLRACLIGALILAASPRAGAVTWAFSGTISSVDPAIAAIDPSIAVGSPFTGSLSYGTPSSGGSQASSAEYQFEGVPFSLTIAVGASVISSISPRDGGIMVFDDDADAGDCAIDELAVLFPGCSAPFDALVPYDHNATLTAGATTVALVDNPFLALFDGTATALADLSLPTAAPDLSAFDGGRLYVDLGEEYLGGPAFFGEIESIAEVPEPATALLGALGLALLGSHPRRWR